MQQQLYSINIGLCIATSIIIILAVYFATETYRAIDIATCIFAMAAALWLSVLIVTAIQFYFSQQQVLQSDVLSEIYRVPANQLTAWEWPSRFYRAMLSSKIIIDPADKVQSLQLSKWQDKFVMARKIDVQFWQLRQETREMLTRFVRWGMEEPANVVWFYGLTEIDRTRYKLESFCKCGRIGWNWYVLPKRFLSLLYGY